ncbi:hypothetical protein BDC45DRAFT_521983 [Circinella umbellata]|nr:hypothetical protein BDC45DRAFT_521983 [Circinella umbellata]
MITTNPVSPHLLTILDSLPDQIYQLNKAIKYNDYQQIIQYTSTTIDSIYQEKQLLLALFELRSHAYSKKGQFLDSIKNGRLMIEAAPASTLGYARLGQTLSTYGYQVSAVCVYNKGLQIVQQNNQSVNVDELHKRKEIAVQRLQKKMDPMSVFSDEIIQSIFSLFSQEVKVTCLQVSTVWRKKLLECSDVWRILKLGQNHKDFPLIGVVNQVTRHVTDLIIDQFTHGSVLSAYMKQLQGGGFENLQYLSFFAPYNYTIENPRDYFASIQMALFRVQNTLTRFDITVHPEHTSSSIKIATILSTCKNLKYLYYSSTASNLSNHVGDLTLLDDNHPNLINLCLHSRKLITGNDVAPILKRCQQLRRLVVFLCDICILDTIQNTAPNLEIFGLNCYFSSVTALEENITERNNDDEKTTGLRYLHLNTIKSNTPSSVAAIKILDLIYKNKATLETIHVEMPDDTTASTASTSIHRENEIGTPYSDFDLVNVKTIFCRSGNQRMEKALLQSIRTSSKLHDLELKRVFKTSLVIDSLIQMTPLNRISLRVSPQPLSIIDSNQTSKVNVDEKRLIQLFQKYAKLPNNTSLSSSMMPPCLTSLGLFYYNNITDNVIKALGQVNTLQEVQLQGLPNISTEGIIEFFKLGAHLTHVSLKRMDSITDDALNVLLNHKALSFLRLVYLKNVTEKGIRNLINKKHSKWMELEMGGMDQIPDSCILDAKKKVKTYRDVYIKQYQ